MGARVKARTIMAKKFVKPTDGYRPDAPDEVLNRSIDDSNLYEETRNKLKSVELFTIGDIAGVEMRQLYRIEKMNKRDVFAVLRLLKSVKLDFRQPPKTENNAEASAKNADENLNGKGGAKIENRGKAQGNKAKDGQGNRGNRGDSPKAKDADGKNVLPTLEREKVNTRDYDLHGNKKRGRERENDRDGKRDGNGRGRDKKPAVINLPPLKIEDGLYKFYKGGKWGYKDESGKIVIEPIYDEAYNFSEGLAGVEIGEKVGFINTSGEMVIPAVYESVTSFKEGLASVTLGEKCAYIDKDGNEVFGFEFEAATSFTNNIALVKKDGKWGYMDRFTGEIRLR